MVRGNWEGQVRNYQGEVSEDGAEQDPGPQPGHEGDIWGQEEVDRGQQDEEEEEEGAEWVDMSHCVLCHKEVDALAGHVKLKPGQAQQLSQVYQIPENSVDFGKFICAKCKFSLHRVATGKKPASILPNLTVTLKPAEGALPETKRKTKPRMESLLKLNPFTMKNLKQKKPELHSLLDQLEAFCGEYGYNAVELCFFLTVKFLNRAGRKEMARALKSLHSNRARHQMSPRKSVANKYFSGRSHRAHRSLALFLKQHLGQSVFSSRKAEDMFVDTLKPKSYSYKLYSVSGDPECENPFKEVIGCVRPSEPDLNEKTEEEKENLRQDYQERLSKYKQDLMTPNFAEKYINDQCESPLPNTLVAIEDYDRLLAAHIHQLGPQILEKIAEINNGNCGVRIPSGRLNAKVLVVDGSDGPMCLENGPRFKKKSIMDDHY